MVFRDHTYTLLFRFHIATIIINIFAVLIDLYLERYANTYIELVTITLLSLSLWYLKSKKNVHNAAYLFLGIISVSLISIVFLNHFATMSVVFVLLLPLTTLIFLRLKNSIIVSFFIFFIIVLLLYIEYLNNPDNQLVHNFQALFNLSYTAIIIYVFGLLYHFSILKTFDDLDDSNKQKALLLSEVHHRVKNNLNIIASIIGLQANSLKKEEQEELLKSKARIESIAIVHEMIYQYDDFENIDFYSYMQRLSTLLLGMHTQGSSIKVNISSQNEKLSLNAMIQLGIITNELFTNSIKHAFKNSKGTISIALEKKADSYEYVYSDDGSSVEKIEDLHKSKSLGLKLIKLSTKKLKASVDITNEGGLKYKLEFKDA